VKWPGVFSVATRSLLGRVVICTGVFNEVVEACRGREYRRKFLAKLTFLISNERVTKSGDYGR